MSENRKAGYSNKRSDILKKDAGSYPKTGRPVFDNREAKQREIIDARREAAIRRKKKKRIQKTILAIIILVAICALVLLIYNTFFVKTVSSGTPVPFVSSSEFTAEVTSGNEFRSDGFASDLCVVDTDVPMESASLETTQSGLLLDLDRQDVMFAQGGHSKVYPASITKIMTAILAFKYGTMSDTVTITQEDVTLEENSQVVGFMEGDQATMDQLVRCLLVYSGNDAASAIARHIGGSVTEFVNMMNAYAQQLGCTETHFTNPHGLTDMDHYTSPYDIYLMLKEALNYPEFTEITQLPSYTITYSHADGSQMVTYLAATDHYLTGEATPPKNVTVLGGKTGTTDLAGNYLAILVQNAYGQPYVSIVMGASSKNVLYTQMNSLLQNIN